MTSISLFNYSDVSEALKKGIIGGIVIDRPDFSLEIDKNPFIDFPNVLFAPAIGSHTHEGQKLCAIQAAKQILDYLDKGLILNQIIR